MKKIIALTLSFAMAMSTYVLAYDMDKATIMAEELQSMGLFKGTDAGFELEKTATRAEAVTMLVRLLGKESEAISTTTKFTDVPTWAVGYVDYAEKNSLTSGTGENTFSPNEKVSATQYLTFVLRALGYSSETDFKWDEANVLASEIGLIKDGEYQANDEFLRSDMVYISHNALDLNIKNTEYTIRDTLDISTSEFAVTHIGTMTIENLGEVKFELYGETAPITVENFVKLANSGFYDGIIFHRVIENFMIQGGDPNGVGTGGSDEKITGEFAKNGIENPILHTRGVLSMARPTDMNGASSQFFIMHADYPSLDGGYAAFGKVISGIEVVDKIATTETDENDKPTTDVVIESIVIEEK